MKPITLPIFHHTYDTSTMKKIGVDYPITDCELRSMTFFNIAAISPYLEDEKEYCSIHANGTEFICEIPYMKVLAQLLNPTP